jgi:hypothetical protein
MASSFQEITVVIALVLLIICLIIIGISLYNKTYNAAYPPVTGDCPDYWQDLGVSSGGGGCVNVQSLGKQDRQICKGPMNFTLSGWEGDDGLCKKSKWANACDLTWDGVTNNNNACSS